MDHSLSGFLSKFSWNFDSAKKAKCFICGITGFLAVIVVLTVFVKPLSFNTSPSAPRGVYLVLPSFGYHYGDFALVSCPADYPPLAKNGDTLLKKIQGFPGDTYTVSDKEVIINNRSYPIFIADHLPHQTPGVYVVPEETVLCLNDPEISFDSRYIGPISKSNLKHRVIQILDYDKIDKKIIQIYKFLGWEVPHAGATS